ncbi:hypothetical protein DRQ20_03820 [bacterium]|nr:MAG: hypothetical protein DRQ20_03820 [bacterium]
MMLFLLMQIELVRLKYSGGGDWYNDPSILPNLAKEFTKRTGIEVVPHEKILTFKDPEIFSHPFVFVTGHGNIVFSEEEIKNIRRYLENGGFIYVDDDYGMDEYIRREIMRIFPSRKLVEVPFDHPIYHIFYDFPQGLPKIHEHYKGPPKGYGIFMDGRLALFYTYNTNISDGWADPEVHRDPPLKRELAIKMGINILLYALTY